MLKHMLPAMAALALVAPPADGADGDAGRVAGHP